MILYCDDNAGVLFHKWDTGTGQYVYGSVTIAGNSTVDAALLGYGRLSGRAVGASSVSAFWRAVAHVSGAIHGFSSTSAKWRAVAKISGSINTFSRVVGDLNKEIIIEVLRFKSKVTKFIRFK